MSKDELSRLGVMALGSRLRRLSENLMRDVRQLYQEEGVDFHPRWFPLFRLLEREQELSVGEAADRLGDWQPSVSLFARQMRQAGWIESRKDPGDQRRSLLSLSPEGQRLSQTLRPLWRRLEAILDAGLQEASEGKLLENLSGLESWQARSSLAERYASQAEVEVESSVDPLDLEVASQGLSAEQLRAFEAINRDWVETHFQVEPEDQAAFDDPQGKILDKGGRILFARYRGELLGTCALSPSEEGLELAKMGVLPKARGLGLGRALMQRALAVAREMGATKVFLLTNSSLTAARQLYLSAGFRITHEGPHPRYRRADLRMEVELPRGESAGTKGRRTRAS